IFAGPVAKRNMANHRLSGCGVAGGRGGSVAQRDAGGRLSVGGMSRRGRCGAVRRAGTWADGSTIAQTIPKLEEQSKKSMLVFKNILAEICSATVPAEDDDCILRMCFLYLQQHI